MDGFALLAVIVVAMAMSGLAWRISSAFRPSLAGRSEVPMQWMIGGEVTRTASPRFALAFTPLLVTGVMAAIVVLSVFATPTDERWMVIPVELAVGLMFAAIHAAHLNYAVRH